MVLCIVRDQQEGAEEGHIGIINLFTVCQTVSSSSRMAGSSISNPENTLHLSDFYQLTLSWPVLYTSFSREKKELR